MTFLILTLPIIGSLLIALTENKEVQRAISLITTAVVFLISNVLWLTYQCSFLKLQNIRTLTWLDTLNLNLTIGIDGISIVFAVLTSLLFFLCIVSSWQILKYNVKEFLYCFLAMETILLAVFFVSDLTFFYILFESVLIPMFILIGVGGSRERKVRAGYMFFLYTIIGSVLMLLSIIFLEVRVGSCSFSVLKEFEFSILEQKLLWLSFFVAFAGKIPMIPLHVWLPEAHVEAPTTGSVILAGILLKLGSYGLIRVSIGIFGKIGIFFAPFVGILGLISLIYSSFTAVRQTDLKRIIAYTSVAHMNLVVIGIFSYTIAGIEGAIFQSLSHGLVSSALFFCVGIVYDRYHTRLLAFYSGLSFFMPNFILFFTFFTMANIALPGTSSFVGEFLMLLGIYKTNTVLCFFSCFSMVLSGGYSLWLLNRFAFGNINAALNPMKDLVLREKFILGFLGLGTLFLGLYAKPVLKEIHFNVLGLV